MVGLYTSGKLKLDELITKPYSLDEVKQGFADRHAGRNIRGAILFDRFLKLEC